MFKNVASQKITFLVIDTAANTPKTGDSANLTAYVSKDDGTVTVLGDTSATELDATNAPGLYSFDLTQAETNADKLLFSGKSSTSGIRVVPILLYTAPNRFTALVIDASGLADATAVKVGPSGSGTAQTARDVGASVLLSSGTGAGQISLSSGAVLLQATQTGVTIPTVTTLTNLPVVPTDWLTAAGVKADAVAKIQSGLSTYAGGDTAGTTTLLTRVTGGVALASTALSTAVWPGNLATNLGIIADDYTNAGVWSVSIGGSVSSVDGDVGGKVLGGGVSTITGTGARVVDGGGNAIPTASAIATALLDLANGVESGITLRQALRAMAAALAGDATGAGTGAEAYRAIGNSGTTRVTPNADASGNRTAVTLNL